MVIGALLVAGFLAVIVVRRRRKVQLAGLDSHRPVFSVEPPHRAVSKRKHESL